MSLGISKETKTTTAKEFKPLQSVNGGLCIGTLKSVDVTEYEVDKDSKLVDFVGKKANRIQFVFEEVVKTAGVAPAIYVHSYNFLEHTNAHRDGILDGMFQTIKHLIGVYRGGEDKITEADYAKLTLGLEATSNPTPDELLAAYKKFFTGVKEVMDSTGFIGKSVWMKLLYSIKGKVIKDGRVAFTSYPGEGLIELVKTGIKPELSVRVNRGESIDPHVTPVSPIAKIPTSEEQIPDFLQKQ